MSPTRPEAEPMRCAVLDLGSTSFQLLVTDAETDGTLTHVLRDRVILNLGADVAATGRVPEEMLDRALEIVSRFRDVAERSGAERLLPVATAAFRDAANLPWISKALRGALGVPIDVLAGDEEARCTVTGVRASVALPPGPWLAFDLGGGSLEIALVDDGRIVWTDSFPLGAARLWSTMVAGDPMTRSERKELKALVSDLLTPAVEASGTAPELPCVMAGGTAGAVCRLLAAGRWSDPPTSLNQFRVTVSALGDVARTLGASTSEERLALPGIDERRADLLPTGAVVLTAALGAFGATSAIHSEWGLREGVVLRALGTPIPTDPTVLRHAAVDRLASRWRLDDRHAATVRRHAETLFDETRAIHDLGAEERELLGAAARLHDVGTRISVDKHHKHGAYIVEHAGLRGFSPDEVALLACLVRFQRGSAPRASYPPYAGLLPTDREACRTLAGLLRVAHALARGGSEDVTSIRVDTSGDALVVRIEGGNPVHAVTDANEHAALLARALGSPIRFAYAEAPKAS
ncbi:MAG TPA: Ppx/GppA phosphatase family protein [Actinomycetota bacterium]|nr:Ppx/GppA phosphatase family protein [Actinomycetota bacterium]